MLQEREKKNANSGIPIFLIFVVLSWICFTYSVFLSLVVST